DETAFLLRSLAVAGFAAMNIMLLSVSVWSGAEAATRDVFHWLSALIALPAVAYAGRPFFRSAINGLSRGAFNMDVPISLAVVLATLMSLFETLNHGEEAYFDASVSLLFFLLAGRTLDQLMRARARSAVTQLMTLAATGALVVEDDGARRFVTVSALRPGMKVQVSAGERLPADGMVVEGSSDIDRSLVSGETMPEAACFGTLVHAGTMNLTGSLIIEVTAAGEDSFLSEVIRLMAAAEQGKSRFVQLADKLARIYAPAVHLLAAVTLSGWLIHTGGDWHTSLMVAIAVLIITCPCALGLAVPAVQVVASGALFRNGVMIKDGAALEKLSQIDTVIFDKTGTLTLNELTLAGPAVIAAPVLALAAGLARSSRHPLARALAAHAASLGIAAEEIAQVSEHPGQGLEARVRGETVRLGSRLWCGVAEGDAGALPEIVLTRGQAAPVIFTFQDVLRPGARETVARLRAQGLHVEILSGDRESAVKRVADELGIADYRAGSTPQVKLAYVEALAKAGRKILMVGDGLNDAPALTAGFTSMAPASASDIGRTAADSVFMGAALTPVAVARDVAEMSQRLAKQNFGLAILYNLFAVPVAMVGLASPFLAAVAMSTSSIIVIGNALRLGFSYRKRVAVRGMLEGVSRETIPIKTREAA
ncbi:MAG: copper-translocating P-type ATPase, partial [Aestuariivirgaceae bacterium]|nr:copper-translocating P-type ATPase [Aestuariivirgaceae bacterium]